MIAVSLSVDAFFLATSYGLIVKSKSKIVLTSVIVGIFHFFMPLVGNKLGVYLFKYTLIKPNIILFLVFLLLSFDMFLSFFENEKKHYKFGLLNIIIFAFSVSFDSFSVGLGIDYLCNNKMVAFFCFSIISFIFTLVGFILGKSLSKKIGKFSFILAGLILLVYSIKMLTK